MQYNETLKTPQCRNNPKNHENHVDKQSVTVYHSVCTVIKVQDDYSHIMSSLIKRKPISYYYIIRINVTSNVGRSHIVPLKDNNFIF
jgi:hypothetical protein